MSLSIKKVSGAFLALIASVALMFGMVSPASAAPTVVVGPGTGYSTIPGVQPSLNACTITALGHDNAGRLVALSAGHCWRTNTGAYPGAAGTPVYKSVTGQQIGVTTNVQAWDGTNPPNPNLDYQVILLDPNVVIPRSTSEDGTVSVTSFGTASLFQNLCKDGIGTGNTCGIVNGTSANSYASFAFAGPGDSGSPAVKAGTGVLVGTLIGGASGSPFTNFIYNKIQPVLNDMNARGSYGAGFTLVP